MRKIPTLFPRDEATGRRFVVVGAEPLVDLAGAVPTRKFNGICLRLDEDGAWWARRQVKPGTPYPDGFVHVEHDGVTGTRIGWVPIAQSSFRRQFERALPARIAEPGTYELIGPEVNGNPENSVVHDLVPHGRYVVETRLTSASYEGVLSLLQRLPEHWEESPGEAATRSRLVWRREGEPIAEAKPIQRPPEHWEGLVWWRSGAPLAKIKRKDFRELAAVSAR